MGKSINFKKPRTFTEKLNWLKIYDRQPEYTIMADKYAVREYIKEKIGEQYLVPLIAVWDDVENIDFASLPEKFVLKCNHDNGVIICTDKKNFNAQKVKKELEYHYKRDYYKKLREWPYKNIKRKIICEKFMQNTNNDSLVDYKVFCFNGVPKFIMVNSNRFGEDGVKTDLYDQSWKYLGIQDGHYPMAGDIFEKPNCLNELLELSKQLSVNAPFLRVDFNYWDNKLYFGELTFYHSGGMQSFQPEEYDYILGDWLKIN